MSDIYQYTDPDYVYTDPKTGLLRNLAGITAREDLLIAESGFSTKRAKELLKKPIKIKDSLSLLEIHKYLFQDIYAWAGQTRKAEIAKSGKQFFPLSHFRQAFLYIDTLLAEYRTLKKKDKKAVADKLSAILDTVNFLHPFREGNGRSQREFVRCLALEKGFMLNMNPPDNLDVYERYMKGTIDGDTKLLSDLILELLSE
ncbi:MAG: Fic family protein [Planctomycetaceae bacterium]|jgi:cell filamentation protein|nr:Fic family protein [Planctomycetaceae bacterium]